jgi:hypothetical protein
VPLTYCRAPTGRKEGKEGKHLLLDLDLIEVGWYVKGARDWIELDGGEREIWIYVDDNLTRK